MSGSHFLEGGHGLVEFAGQEGEGESRRSPAKNVDIKNQVGGGPSGEAGRSLPRGAIRRQLTFILRAGPQEALVSFAFDHWSETARNKDCSGMRIRSSSEMFCWSIHWVAVGGQEGGVRSDRAP